MTLEGFIFYWLVIALGVLILGGLEFLMGKWRTAPPNRTRPRIPRRERELLGDDYRELVAPYFRRRAQAERARHGR